MLRSTFAVLLLALLAPSVLGASIQLVSGLSGSYSTGQSVSFDVQLPAIANLGSYNIDLILESSIGTAGVDYFFDPAATSPAASNYVFPTATNYFDAVTVDSATRDRLTLSDFDFAGMNVVPGTNDKVAKVVFRTLPTFRGSLSVFADAPLLILDTPDVVPTPVSGFSGIQDGITVAGPVGLTPVPEPTRVMSLIVVAAAWLAGRPNRRSCTSR